MLTKVRQWQNGRILNKLRVCQQHYQRWVCVYFSVKTSDNCLIEERNVLWKNACKLLAVHSVKYQTIWITFWWHFRVLEVSFSKTFSMTKMQWQADFILSDRNRIPIFSSNWHDNWKYAETVSNFLSKRFYGIGNFFCQLQKEGFCTSVITRRALKIGTNQFQRLRLWLV